MELGSRDVLMKEFRFHAVMTVIVLPVAAFSVIGALAWQIRVAPGQLILRGALLLVLLAGAAFYRWRRLEKAENLILMTFWAVLITNLYLLPEYIIARRNISYSDSLLARTDALLGVEVPDVLRLMDAAPFLAAVLRLAYGLLILLVMLAVMVPPMVGRMDKAKEYAVACLAAASFSLPVFALVQAVGPASVYGYPPSPLEEGVQQTFQILKSDAVYVLDLGDFDGLICFPSFHTALAVLAAVALWPVRYLRWPSTAVAVLIVLSTVPAGGHYVVDILGGLAVSAAALAVARVYLRWEAGGSRALGRLREEHPGQSSGAHADAARLAEGQPAAAVGGPGT
jgi:membrane-associated phospholipid phosphatase